MVERHGLAESLNPKFGENLRTFSATFPAMDIRVLSLDDVEAMWAINEEGLPGTGQVSAKELAVLLDLASYSIGIGL